MSRARKFEDSMEDLFAPESNERKKCAAKKARRDEAAARSSCSAVGPAAPVISDISKISGVAPGLRQYQRDSPAGRRILTISTYLEMVNVPLQDRDPDPASDIPPSKPVRRMRTRELREPVEDLTDWPMFRAYISSAILER